MEKELMLDEIQREIEILEIRAGGNSYGINIKDIKEILPYDKMPRKIHNSHPYIEGIVKPREFIIPIIDLVAGLKLEDIENVESEMLLVSNINDMNIGFHVDYVSAIHKITKANITEPDEKLSTSVSDVVTGILTLEGRKIEIIELRKVINSINSDIKFE